MTYRPSSHFPRSISAHRFEQNGLNRSAVGVPHSGHTGVFSCGFDIVLPWAMPLNDYSYHLAAIIPMNFRPDGRPGVDASRSLKSKTCPLQKQ